MPAKLVNIDQAAAWDGDEGAHWAEHQDRYDATVRRHHVRLFEAVDFRDGDRVVDIGCGNGQSTRDAARRIGSGLALGVDLSARMLDRARRRAEAEGVTNAVFEQADAQVHDFGERRFDVAISRFGAMFFSDPVAAFSNIAAALRPGGRLAMLAWQRLDQNEWLQALRGALAAGRTLPEPPPEAPSPFALADPGRVRRILSAAGFGDVELAAVEEPIHFGDSIDDAFAFLSGSGAAKGLLEGLDERARARALGRLRRTVEEHHGRAGVTFGTAAWRITARAGARPR